LCEQTLGVKAIFTAYVPYSNVTGSFGDLLVSTVIEGVTVRYDPIHPGLSHDLARLGACIQSAEQAAKEAAERDVRLAAVRTARTCDRCGEVSTYRWDGKFVRDDFPSDQDNVEALAHHKKQDCRKVPWLKRRL
jgi:hypothetical protein